MSKYDALWNWIKENGTDSFKLSYDEIEKIAGLPIDHSFLTYNYHPFFIVTPYTRQSAP